MRAAAFAGIMAAAGDPAGADSTVDAAFAGGAGAPATPAPVALPAPPPPGAAEEPAAAPAAAPEAEMARLLDLADRVRVPEEVQLAREYLERAEKIDPGHPMLLWMAARGLWILAETIDRDDKKERMRHYDQALKYTAQCRKAHPDNAECLFWETATMGRRATLRGVVRSFLDGSFRPKDVETRFLQVLAMKPTYKHPFGTTSTRGDAYTSLGMFYRQAPTGFLARLIVGIEGDRRRAVEYTRRAVDILPGNIAYVKEYAVALICLGMTEDDQRYIEQGKEQLRRVLELPRKHGIDDIDKQHALWLLNEPKVACKYNRDGIQEIESDYAKSRPERQIKPPPP